MTLQSGSLPITREAAVEAAKASPFRLLHLQARGLKGRDVDVDLAPVTVFVGPNRVGKSTALDALYFGLFGPGKDRRDRAIGKGPVSIAVRLASPGAETASGQITVNRKLPEHAVTVQGLPVGRNAGIKETQRALQSLLALPAEVWDLPAFARSSDEEVTRALEPLLDYIEPAPYLPLCRQVAAVPGEDAAAWLRKAGDFVRRRILAAQATVRTAEADASKLDAQIDGRAPTTIEAEIAELRERVAAADRAVDAKRALDAAEAAVIKLRAELDALGAAPDAVAGELVDEGPIEATLGRLQEQARTVRQAEDDLALVLRRLQSARAASGRLDTARAPVRRRLAMLYAALLRGDIGAATAAVRTLEEALIAHGFPSDDGLGSQLAQDAERADALQRLIEEHPSLGCITAALDQGRAELEAARKHNLRVQAASRAVASHSADVARLTAALHAADKKAAVARTELEALPETVVAPQDKARLGRLLEEHKVALRAEGLREAAEARRREAAEAEAAIPDLKGIETRLRQAQREVLGEALASVKAVMDPVLAIIGAVYEPGDGVPLGCRRGETWIPFEALSDSEREVFLAALALALTSRRKGLRLVLLDRLDVLDEATQLRLLQVASALVDAGRLDALLATSCHLRPAVVGGIRHLRLVRVEEAVS